MTFPCLPVDGRRLDAEICAIGLMSGTSLDGVDAALLTTDGVGVVRPGPALTVAYPRSFKKELRPLLGLDPTTDHPRVSAVEAKLTDWHGQAVEELLALLQQHPSSGLKPELIGFHGHTLTHAPARGWTWQLGDGDALARRVGLMVVSDFRSADIGAGGQGAPLVPLFHQALIMQMKTLKKPLAVLNIGGIANVSWVGADDRLLAFDCGPGNALIDDWMQHHRLGDYDVNGALASKGRVNTDILNHLLNHDYFQQSPPKSLDRLAFNTDILTRAGLSAADGAATLTAFTSRAIALSGRYFPDSPKSWLVTGGGRLNNHLMACLGDDLAGPVEPIESLGWSGDALEAQAFAYLAVRAYKGLPLSDPAVTGATRSLSGGCFHEADVEKNIQQNKPI